MKGRERERRRERRREVDMEHVDDTGQSIEYDIVPAARLEIDLKIEREGEGVDMAEEAATMERRHHNTVVVVEELASSEGMNNPEEQDVEDGGENGNMIDPRRSGHHHRDGMFMMEQKHGIVMGRDMHSGAEPREPGGAMMMDEEPMNMDDDAPTTPTGPAGGDLDRKDRMYKKGPWSVTEMLVLQSAKKEDVVRAGKGAPRDKHRTAQEKWQSIEDYCWSHLVQRSAQQCQDKWESMSAEFKKVKDYESGTLQGQKSYWQMTIDERKGVRVPPNFQKEVYQALLEWYDKNRIIEPGYYYDVYLSSCFFCAKNFGEIQFRAWNAFFPFMSPGQNFTY